MAERLVLGIDTWSLDRVPAMRAESV